MPAGGRTRSPARAGSRTRSPAGPDPDLQPGDPARQAAGRVAGDGAGTHPQPRLGPDDRTAVQPAVAAMPPSPGPAHPVRAAYQAAPVPSPAATGAQEDPLTSPAYALRPKGAVDGRSPQSSRHSMDANGGDTGRRPGASWAGPLPSDRSRPGPSASGGTVASPAYRPVPADGYRGSTAYLYQQQPSGEPLPSSTPPYGQRFGYPDPAGQAGPVGGPGDANGGWHPGQEGGHGDAAGVVRPTRPPTATARLTSRGLRPLVTSLGRPRVHRGRQAGGPADAWLRRDPAAGFLHNVSSGIRHGLCPRETWCGTPPAACTRRWRDGP